MTTFVLAAAVASSIMCTPPPRQLPVKELATYITSFAQHSQGKVQVADMTDSVYEYAKLGWVEGKGGIIADCVSDSHTLPFLIHVDEMYWTQSNFPNRWAIIFHELGHCVCGREHTLEQGNEWVVNALEKAGLKVVHAHRLPDGCPDSLMNWAVPQGSCLVVHRDEYIDELFRKCKIPTRKGK